MTSVMNSSDSPPLPDDLFQAVERLTAKEKDCLRRWMDHQTAKQIALDLGISHHAVEKRLKTARMKLSVTSSIEAAQILAEAEGYGQTVSYSPDLSDTAIASHKRRSNSLMIGAIIMTISLAVLAIIGLQADLTAPANEQGVTLEADAFVVEQSGQVEALSIVRLSAEDDGLEAPTNEEMKEFLSDRFRQLDTNADGAISVDEAPTHIAIAERNTQFIVDGEKARVAFFDRYDRDADLLVSNSEYIETSMRNYEKSGILLVQKVTALAE